MEDKKQNTEDTSKEESPKKDKLEKLELKVNKLGEITSNLDLDQINKFLDENVEDKKLKNEDDDKG